MMHDKVKQAAVNTMQCGRGTAMALSRSQKAVFESTNEMKEKWSALLVKALVQHMAMHCTSIMNCTRSIYWYVKVR
jgi:hypothetical protein